MSQTETPNAAACPDLGLSRQCRNFPNRFRHFLSYIGGKNRLAKTIISLIPKHKTYVEPFFGGGQVFFHKEPSAVEIINDLNQEIFNFFRTCQHHHEELIRYLKYTLISRKWFEIQSALNEIARILPERATSILNTPEFDHIRSRVSALPAR